MIRIGTLLYLFLLISVSVKAQQERTPNLSQIHIGVGFLPVLQFSPNNFDYSPSQMTRLSLGTNYLSGNINANLQYAYMTSPNQRPNCRMFDASLSYLYHITLPKNFFIYSGLQFGSNTIHFEGDDIPDDRDFETEVSGGIEFGIEKRFRDKIGISCSYKLQRIFATPRNNLSMMDIGISYYFNSNDKLRQWLE